MFTPPLVTNSKQICLYPINELFSNFSVGFCINEDKTICWFVLIITGPSSRNFGKLFSNLKLVTDNLLFTKQRCSYPINEWKHQKMMFTGNKHISTRRSIILCKIIKPLTGIYIVTCRINFLTIGKWWIEGHVIMCLKDHIFRLNKVRGCFKMRTDGGALHVCEWSYCHI